MFTSAVGPTRAWYRYHPLFAELLRAELHYGHAAELPGLHRRAAAWHADAGQPVPAVRHALAAGDVDQAAGLLATDWAPLLAEGQAAMLGELVSRLPGERVRSSPELAVVAALSRLALGELEEADAWLGVAAAAEPPFAGPPAGRGAAMHLARLYRARLAGEVADAGSAARGLLAPDGTLTLERSCADDDQRTLAYTLLGSTQLWSGQLEEAAANLERARDDAERTGRQVIKVAAIANLALLEAVQGRLGRAGELAQLASEQAKGAAWPATTQLASAQLATAVCAYHRDDLAAASAALDQAPRAALPGDRPLRLAAAVLGGWMAAASGRDQAGAALRHLDGAIAATGGRPPGCWTPRPGRPGRGCWPRPATTRRRWPPSAPASEPRPAVATVVLARLQLAKGDPTAALRTLAPLLAGEPGGPALAPPLAIEANLVEAVADQELADHAAAVGALRRALDLAAPEGYRRAFVEGGSPVRQLLADHLHWDSAHHPLVGALLERVQAAEPAGRAGAGRAAPAALVVPLSEREQVVLRYLSSRLSAGEIADELYVSLNTVKTHIKSIYRKLDTNRRWDAVKRARQLQLL